MRTVFYSGLLSASLVVAWGCGQNESPSATGPFAARFKAAHNIGDPVKRDEAHAKLAQDAAESGDVGATKKALHMIGDSNMRDSATAASAQSLAKGDKREEAVGVAMTIGDPKTRDATLAQIAKADTGSR